MRDFSTIVNKNEAKTLIDLETYLKNRLHQFQPNHNKPNRNKPKCQPEPVEKWEIGSLHFLDAQKPIEGVKRRIF